MLIGEKETSQDEKVQTIFKQRVLCFVFEPDIGMPLTTAGRPHWRVT